MSFHTGDRVFHRGTRKSGVIFSESRAGTVDVRTEENRVEIWPIIDIVLDEPGAEDPNQPGRGHIGDTRHTELKGKEGT